MAFTQITVTGTYREPNNTPAAGAVEFTPAVPMRNGSTVIAAPVSGQLNSSGVVSVSLAATTDPGTAPSGNTYYVTEYLTNQSAPRKYSITVPHNDGPIDLASVAPAIPAPVLNTYLTQQTADARYMLESAGGSFALAGATSTALAGKQPVDDDLTTIAALSSATAGALVTDGSGWIRKTYAQMKTALALVKGDVGLGNVDNTSDLALGQSLGVAATVPLSSVVGNAGANVTAINAAISAVSTAGGGVVLIPGASTFYLDGHVLMRSGVTLRLAAGVTLKKIDNATGNICLLRNANPLVSPPYTDQGMVIEGGTWDGNYAGNSATLVTAETGTLTGTALYGVQGELSLVGVQNAVVRNTSIVNGNGFAVQVLGSRVTIAAVTLDTARDGIHVSGGTRHLTIADVSGYTSDDFIALNAWDWARSGPVAADIRDVTIDRCSHLGVSASRPTTYSAAVKLLAGTRASGYGAGTGNIYGVTIRGLHSEGRGFAILSDYDQVGSTYSGAGVVENVTIDDSTFVPFAASGSAIAIYKDANGTPADGQTSLTIRNMLFRNCRFDLATNSTASAVGISYIYTGLAVQGLTFRDCTWSPVAGAGSGQFLNVQSKSILDSIEVDGLTWLTAGGGSRLAAINVGIYSGSSPSEVKTLGLHRLMTAPGVALDGPIVLVQGIISQLNAREWALTFTGGTSDNHGIVFGNAVALLRNAVLSGFNLTNPKTLIRIGNGATGSVICAATVRDCNLSGSTHPVYVSGSGRQAVVRFRGGKIDTPNNLARVDAATLTTSFDGTTSSGVGASVITLLNTPTVRVVKSDAISLSLSTLALTPADGDVVMSTGTPSSVVSGTGAGLYAYRGGAGWVKLN